MSSNSSETNGPSPDLEPSDPVSAAAIAAMDARIERSPWRVVEAHRFGLPALRAHLGEVWFHRALVWVLVRRELKARYRGSVLGFGWTLVNPLALLAVYSLVFSVYMRIEMPHYSLYLLSGLLPWLWLSQTLTSGSNSIIDGKTLVTRVLLPPQLLPIVETLANGVNFVLGVPVLLVAALVLDSLSVAIAVTLPVAVVLQALVLLGISMPLAAAAVLFRDIKFLVQNFITFWFFLTPIVYPVTFVPENLRFFLALNPFFPFARAYQAAIYEGSLPGLRIFAGMALMAGIAVVLGLILFERIRERVVEEL